MRREIDPGGAAGKRIEVRIGPGSTAVVGHRELIRMALGNLLGNALKHAGATAAIVVSVAPTPDGRVAVTVADDGAGMPPEVQASAFEPFVRAKPEGDGFGLGLAVVKAILRGHGTEPVLASALGGGTRISFSLAAANAR